jgi:hypothetical protein
MKTIEINKDGFGIASLFTSDSTKETLIEARGMTGDFLEDLNLNFNVGDVITIKTPCRNINAFTVCKVRVYNITDSLYECEFYHPES